MLVAFSREGTPVVRNVGFVQLANTGLGGTTDQKIDAATALIMQVLLGKNDCSQFFDESATAWATIEHVPRQSAAAMFARVNVVSVANSGFIRAAAYTNQGTGAASTITVNMNSPFSFGVRPTPNGPPTYYWLGPFISATTQGNAVVLLHEFAHNIQAVSPDNSGLDPSGMVSASNTGTILKHCTTAIQSAE